MNAFLAWILVWILNLFANMCANFYRSHDVFAGCVTDAFTNFIADVGLRQKWHHAKLKRGNINTPTRDTVATAKTCPEAENEPGQRLCDL